MTPFRALIAALFAAFLTVATPFAAMADTLTGKEAATLMVSDKRTFAAGSEARFKSDGTYTFAHTNGTDSGTFTVKSNGQITMKHTAGPSKGKTDVFVVDETNGGYAARYVKGRLRGESYAFK